MVRPEPEEDDIAFDIVIVAITFGTFILILVAICFTYSLYGQRKKLYVQKRYHKTLRNGADYPISYSIDAIFGLNTAIIFGMLMSVTTLLIQNYSNDDTVDLIIDSASYGPWFLIMLFLNVKNWNLFFRFKIQHYAVQSEWQKIINPDETQKRLDHNWYIRNNKTWGNLSTVYAYFGVMHWLLLCAVITIDIIENSNYVDNLTMTIIAVLSVAKIVLFVLPFLLYIGIEVKTPSFNDLFFIHWESRMQAICTAILILITLTADILEGTVIR